MTSEARTHTYCAWAACAFIDNFIHILSKRCISPIPESMLFADEDRLEGLKHNNNLGERWGKTGAGERYVNYAKKGSVNGSVSTLLSLLVGLYMFSIKVN